MDEDLKKAIKTVGILSTVGMAMVLSIAIGALAGYYMDKWLGTAPIFLLIGIGLGIGAAFRNLFILTKRARDQ
ncbi:MAG: AtpZ/AtpI family protein [Deltaproteobacteria bacterium]|nr:AtpZ/AtpI family protein [Deltaproteobacteria bacterium]MBW1930638.1 AtpZ/AtpI family protein [Deltaproteobacteria bacterium]MBW2023949.1 AtpZ/AtpI family protein [Deltaproteobacteria bacterium]MBW2124294.1 AtpZ/AtpI family protein [Deltaproteobacteria bacterium]RLB17052.1 MAG: magnesium transporter [Deltaproteobacteria bacterium]